jgi:hypothetical protein
MKQLYISRDALLLFEMEQPAPLINAKTSKTGKRTKTTNNAQHAKGQHRQNHPENGRRVGLFELFVLFVFAPHICNNLLLLFSTPCI